MYYIKGEDRIIGFQNFGTGEMNNIIVNKALVFMCQGITRNWK